MEFQFTGSIIEWRGPAPFYYVVVPEEHSEVIADHAAMLTYGWGVIPVEVAIGDVDFTTSLFPRDGRYLVPLKRAVRTAAGLGESGSVQLIMRTAAV